MDDKYYVTERKYLAHSLSFLGFRFYKFVNEGSVGYSFENTVTLQKALGELLELKRNII